MSKELYISDLHFSHANAISFDNRPWKDINEMNEEIIRIWNERVTDEDDVWILGDISWTGPYETRCLIARLRGKKHWVTGNHDYKLLKNEELCRQFVDVYECYHKHIDKAGNTVILSHFPIFMFDGVYHGHTVHLYGHVHTNQHDCDMIEKWKKEYESVVGHEVKMYNVGIMCPGMEWGPRTLDEIIGGKE